MIKKITNKRKISTLTSYYLLLGLLLGWQLGLTLYQIGSSIGYRAQLARLNQQYQTLSQEKAKLNLSSSQKVSLETVENKAKANGFIKIKHVARIGLDQHLAAL